MNSMLKVIICTSFLLVVDGVWGSWRNVTRCSATCGGGTMNQARDCKSPNQKHGDDDCVGNGERTIDCNTQPCPGIACYSTMQNSLTKIIIRFISLYANSYRDALIS